MKTMYEKSSNIIYLTELRRRERRERRAWCLDTCASLAVVVMTLVIALRVLL